MSEIRLHGVPVATVFDLLGRRENDMTFALGWGLARSPRLLSELLAALGIHGVNSDECVINLQRHDALGGFTDLELTAGGQLHLILEAKRGWALPSELQLGLYLDRLIARPAQDSGLVVLTQWGGESVAKARIAALQLPVACHVLGWSQVAALTQAAAHSRRPAERRLLQELSRYLWGVADMRETESNQVYVVSLGRRRDEGWPIDFVQVVEQHSRYFYPASGMRWPKVPPNYMAFRYAGRLQSVRHVDDYTIATDMSAFFPGVPSGEWEPHFVLSLGPPIVPDHPVANGPSIQRSSRVWADIDLLLTAPTISDAWRESKARARAAP
jgi:hypothetical protein